MGKSGGRPEWHPSEKDILTIQAGVVAGYTRDTIADQLHISARTLYRYAKRYKQFSQLLQRANDLYVGGLAARAHEIAMSDKPSDPGAMIRWLLSRRGGPAWKESDVPEEHPGDSVYFERRTTISVTELIRRVKTKANLEIA